MLVCMLSLDDKCVTYLDATDCNRWLPTCFLADGIRFVRDKRPTLCGCPCTDAGKSSKTVPFDKITDCDIEEPGGNTCICVQNVLTSVLVDTASSGGADPNGAVRHELVIRGLKDPYGFKKVRSVEFSLNLSQFLYPQILVSTL